METFLGIIGIVACLVVAFMSGLMWFLVQIGKMFSSTRDGFEIFVTWVAPCVLIGALYLVHRILVFLYH